MDLKDYIVTYDDVLDVNHVRMLLNISMKIMTAVTRYDAEMCGFSCLNLTDEVEVKNNKVESCQSTGSLSN